MTLSDRGPLYLNPCYNTLITRPLAWLGSTNAQEKMAQFWMQEELRKIDDLRLEIQKRKEDIKVIEANKPQEKDWSWEDELQGRRNDTTLIQGCIAFIKEITSSEIECVDLVAHTFTSEGRNLYFNHDFYFLMEYPQGFLVPINEAELMTVSHGGLIVSPDTTVAINIYHGPVYGSDGSSFGVLRAVAVDTGLMWLDQKTCIQEDITDWVNGEIQLLKSAGITVTGQKRHIRQKQVQLWDNSSAIRSDLVLTLIGRNQGRNIYSQRILRIYYDVQGNILESLLPPEKCCVTVEYPDEQAKVGNEIIRYIKNSHWSLS